MFAVDSATFFASAAELETVQLNDVVTFSCAQFSKFGLPVGPKFKAVRCDASWDDITRDYSFEPVKTANGNLLLYVFIYTNL